MKALIQSSRFMRDLKRLKKRNFQLAKITPIVDLLIEGQPLPQRCRPHKLVGQYFGFWECHIEPDWLLVYDLTDTEVVLVATGTHVDLF